ncbi:MAG TPA: Xaa-Pro peptidase family protein [Candidatus Acidoferrales bacterium]|nr:Xaa-Pro peptidase family protein [Candidatus Acidoferrales bacterium]
MSRIQENLHTAGLAAVVCSLPSNVLLLTGYWPVVGESIAICVCGGPTVLLVPEDEADLAGAGFADSIEAFVPETLDEMSSVSAAVKPHLAHILNQLKVIPGQIGIESGPSSQAASYLAIHLFGSKLPDMLHELLPASTLIPIDEWIHNLKSIKTPAELGRIRQACAIVKSAYELAAPQLHAGMREPEAAELFRAPLSRTEVSGPWIHRNDGFAFCMSGPNSAKAYAAYARTRRRKLESIDLVMMHCNSYFDGFWTDITRTFTLQPPGERQEEMYAAVFAARKAALAAIKPRMPAAEVDAAARQVIRDFGLGPYLKHGTGHGVGFSPMSAYSSPRIHAGSSDVLEEGMVFNVEPAVYIEGYGGVRHCDMVAVTSNGYELLTDFQSNLESLTATKANHLPRQPIQAKASS